MIACGGCGREIADEDTAIEVLGRHRHECVNPGGFRYEVGCYAAAPGLEVASDLSSEWSWFPGFQWQIEECAGCHAMLGWLFVRKGGEEKFHALILDKVTG